MPQASLMTWLKQPKTVKEPPSGPADLEENAIETRPGQLPTPPEDGEASVASDNSHISKETLAGLPLKGLKPLPPNVELRSCSKEDIPHLKRLTSLLLPIPYPEKFYKEIIEDPLTNNITLLAVWHDVPAMKGVEKGRLVGAIRCRLLAHPPTQNSSSGRRTEDPMLYLSTLVLLSPYRSHGIASHLLHSLTTRAVEDYGIKSVGAHVWEANTEGLDWYRKRKFREVGKEPGYYRRLDPQAAIVMQRDVSVMDLVT
ncbi:acyl- N-acyltransferase [Lecanosticta acicola]|uniref:Acyl- N-acyltransferase, partial n=1 Tax=Lecanosticta acicola TaxID=111012 RepID=A0AAI9EFU0_9PEZI|nr:acyl- N-acyltransferase [Lecanosticta acicola]